MRLGLILQLLSLAFIDNCFDGGFFVPLKGKLRGYQT
ncbi:hypothetical protein LPC_0053 [Legionella pneumophila str. Corby]|nr:hypothetical protein LPC_0053 [Legionella pneumophila str. Corby]